MSDVFPKSGIKISYLVGEFLDIILDGIISGTSSSSVTVKGLTTEDVCQQVIKQQLTIHEKSSYCDVLKKQGHPAWVEKADAFISHAHSYLFTDLISALRWKFRDEPECSVWIDLFSINQHEPINWTFEWLSTTFRTNVEEIGRTIMVMSPWDDPLPYTRSWCVFEAFCSAADLDGKFEIAMSKNDEQAFLRDIQNDDSRINTMLATIRSEKSQCSVKSDRESIFAVIRASVGFSKLDSMVFACYRQWVIEVSLEALKVCTSGHERLGLLSTVGALYSAQGKYEEAEYYKTRRLELARSRLGEDDSVTLLAMYNLGITLRKQGKYAKAEYLHRSCLERQTTILGDGHSDTLRTLNALAGTCFFQGKYSDAEQLYNSCLEQRNVVLGEDHPDTLRSMNGLAVLFEYQGRYDKAEGMYQICLERQKTTLGHGHPDTLTTIHNLAGTLRSQERYTEAEDLYTICMEKRKSILGEDHPSTLRTMNGLAGTYFHQDQYVKAEELYCSCLERRKAALGDGHPDTLSTMNDLAGVLEIQEKESKTLYHSCLELRKVVLGEGHPDTLSTMENLARACFVQGDYEETVEVCRECLNWRKATLGGDHPDSVRTMNDLTEALECLQQVQEGQSG